MRLKLKRKAYRGRLALTEPTRRNRIIQCCYLGGPIERMMSTLQHRDGTGKILYDLTSSTTSVNPIRTCCASLCKMMSDVDRGLLGPVLEYFDGLGRAAFTAETHS
eukprot:8053831-Pyramimonas_sp.AAC.1